jgi:multicomponent Na+:H+ antiporter subunit E
VIRALRILIMTLVWLAMWSDLSVANVASGLLVSAAVVTAFDTWRSGTVAVRPVRAAHFGVWFVYKLVEATISVVWAVLAPRGRVHTGIISVPLQGCSDAVATLIADAISLTPGTLTIEVRRDPLTLYIHALDTRDLESIRRDVRRLEILAVQAFGDEAAIAGLEVDDSVSMEAS